MTIHLPSRSAPVTQNRTAARYAIFACHAHRGSVVPVKFWSSSLHCHFPSNVTAEGRARPLATLPHS